MGGERDRFFMQQALAEAENAFHVGEVPIGAIVVQDDRVVSRGYNRRETWRDPTAHAEILAIRQASALLAAWRLTGCTVYVTLEPCTMCAGALVLARVDRLVYGAADPKAGGVTSLYQIPEDKRLNHRMEITAGVLQEECSDIMRRFFLKLREKGRHHGCTVHDVDLPPSRV